VSISEQPRRLLLPQEIKELGPGRMILFYEGLRPVLARRVTYWRDPVFAKRELPPPEVPRLDVAAVRRTSTREPDDAEGSIATEGERRARLRPVRPDDVVRLDELTLDDFSLDFGHIEIPKGRPMTDAEVQQAVDRFLATLEE
jgi:type IV secretion system protein VirD4